MWLGVAAASLLYMFSALMFVFDVEPALVPAAVGTAVLAVNAEGRLMPWLALAAVGFGTVTYWPYGLVPWAACAAAVGLVVPVGSPWGLRVGAVGAGSSLLVFMFFLVAGYPHDMALVCVWAALGCFLCAWVVWHKQAPSKLNYVLLAAALAHMVQAVLTLLPKTPHHAAPMVVAGFYGLVLVYIAAMLQQDRDTKQAVTMAALINWDGRD